MSDVSANRRRLVSLLGGGLLALPAGAFAARGATLGAARLVHQTNVVLHLDLDAAMGGARLFTLEDPHRLVIDLPGTDLGAGAGPESFDSGPVAGIRYGRQGDGALRVVVDLRRAAAPTFRFLARPGGQRLVVDLGVRADPALATTRHRIVEPAPLRDVVVAIDAGHGGKDPGAIGQRATREKDITLAVARRLYRRLSAVRGVTPVMVRDDDTYVALRERMRIARSRRADLFVSIHADAFKRREARGSSVYTLGRKGASSEAAAWLAKAENESAALFGDVTLDGLEASLRQTLLDLAQSSTLEASMDCGAEVLARLKDIGAVHKPHVEQANFAVLKSPDMPSMLIETAFISNLQEEKKLNDSGFQKDLAVAIGDGLSSYLARRAPSGTLLAAQRQQAAG